MANTLKIKRGTAATIPQGQLAEPLFTTDTYDLYIGKGSGGNQRFQKYIASGTSSQFLKGDGSLDSTTYQATSEKGQNNGYASLDSGGKVPAAQLPNSIMDYKGTWDASTNTPTLADGTGNAGDVYIVSVGGTQNLGSGSITFAAGDWVVYSGSVWQKSINSNAVASVNGQTGAVVLTTTNISEGTNLYYTDTRARASLSATSPVQYSTSTGVISILDASATQSGVVTTGTQTFEGVKTFNSFLISKQEVVLQKNSVSGGSGYYSLKTNSNVNRWTIGAATVETGSNVGYDFNIYRYDDSGAGLGSVMEIIRSNGNVFFTNNITASSIIKSGGTSSQFLKADGSVDSTSYLPISGGTLTGNLILPANNTVGGTNYAIQQTMASNDQWRIYGNSVAIDQGELVFELADNAQSWGSNGQRYRFYFNNTSTGTSKDVLIMDYDTAVFTTSVTATSIIRSGGTSSQFLKADGSVDSTSYLPLSGGTLTGSLTATAFIPSGSTIPTNGMYLPSANTVAFAANSTRVIQISDSGRVSIGATTPTADTLTVHGAITTTNGGKITAQGMIEAGSTIFGGLNCIIVSDLSAASITPTGSTSPVNGMYLPSANTIAFSTLASPRLTIGSTGAATFSSSVTANGTMQLADDGTYGSSYKMLALTGSTNGSHRIFAGASNSDHLYIAAGTGRGIAFWTDGSSALKAFISTTGAATFSSSVTASGNIQTDGTVNKYIKATGFISNQVGQLSDFGAFDAGFYIVSGGGTQFVTGGANAMRITSGGNVGIGTTNPTGAAGLALVLNSGASQGRICIKTSTTGDASGDGLQIGMSGNDAFIEQRENADLTFATNASERMRITNGGNVLIGTTSDNGGRLQVSGGDVRVSGGVRFSSSGADANRWSVYWNGGTGDLIVVNNISDIRAKKDFDYNIKGLETIQKLKPLKFTWKDGTSHSTSVSGRLRQYGFIAQETMEADDFLAWYNESQDSWGIEQYESFSAVIVKAIQEQQAQIEELKSKL